MFDIEDVIENDLDPTKMAELIDRCANVIRGDGSPESKWLRGLLKIMGDDCRLAASDAPVI